MVVNNEEIHGILSFFRLLVDRVASFGDGGELVGQFTGVDRLQKIGSAPGRQRRRQRVTPQRRQPLVAGWRKFVHSFSFVWPRTLPPQRLRRDISVAPPTKIKSSPGGAAYFAPTELGSFGDFTFYKDASPAGLQISNAEGRMKRESSRSFAKSNRCFPQSNGCWPESCGRFWERNDDFLESNGWFLTVGRFQRPGRHSKKNLQKGKVFRRATRRV
jgi:hypothetical protein